MSTQVISAPNVQSTCPFDSSLLKPANPMLAIVVATSAAQVEVARTNDVDQQITAKMLQILKAKQEENEALKAKIKTFKEAQVKSEAAFDARIKTLDESNTKQAQENAAQRTTIATLQASFNNLQAFYQTYSNKVTKAMGNRFYRRRG